MRQTISSAPSRVSRQQVPTTASRSVRSRGLFVWLRPVSVRRHLLQASGLRWGPIGCIRGREPTAGMPGRSVCRQTADRDPPACGSPSSWGGTGSVPRFWGQSSLDRPVLRVRAAGIVLSCGSSRGDRPVLGVRAAGIHRSGCCIGRDLPFDGKRGQTYETLFPADGPSPASGMLALRQLRLARAPVLRYHLPSRGLCASRYVVPVDRSGPIDRTLRPVEDISPWPTHHGPGPARERHRP